jgi:hypothetical protein
MNAGIRVVADVESPELDDISRIPAHFRMVTAGSAQINNASEFKLHSSLTYDSSATAIDS